MDMSDLKRGPVPAGAKDAAIVIQKHRVFQIADCLIDLVVFPVGQGRVERWGGIVWIQLAGPLELEFSGFEIPEFGVGFAEITSE